MAVYKLPTRSPRQYRGKYPRRIHSYSGGHCVHVELNNGERYVMTPSALTEYAKRSSSIMGWELKEALKWNSEIIEMSLADYAGILLVIRIIRCLKYGWPINTPALGGNFK